MVLIASSLIGATLKDVSYSIKQNGIMVNLDYTDAIDDDDIIGWKSDRGWVYLTLLGVRAPKNKVVDQDFSGDVRKIVIDDFDESTQLAILIRRPILGYDIINSKTSPSTIVFIHTEMKKSEVATLKQHIEEKGTSVFNVAKSSGFPKYNTNFKNAFDEARNELGPNAIFEYHGKLYTTNHPGEKEVLARSILMKKSVGPIKNGELDNFTIRNFSENSVTDSLIKEVYVNRSTGETLTETIEELSIANNDIKVQSEESTNKDDGWFSGDFPTYSQTTNKPAIEKQFPVKKDTIIQNEKPVFVESFPKREMSKKKNWKNIFNIFKREKAISQNNDELEKNINDDSNPVELAEAKDIADSLSNNFSDFQTKFIPPNNQNIKMESIDQSGYVISETQLSDTNIVQILELEDFSESERNTFHELQKEYIPKELYYKQDTSGFAQLYEPSTQEPDTNIIEAWFTDENLIPDDYDARHLQTQHVPSRNNINDMTIIPIEDSFLSESLPLDPEFTDPPVLDKRLKTRYKNKDLILKPKSNKDIPFQPNTKESNTWLSFFSDQGDSMKESLKWDFKEENQVPPFLQTQKEVLDYSSRDNGKYRWKDPYPDKQAKQIIDRQSDPGFMYYYNGGIRVQANMAGVPIYIDGNYVGETPLARPIQVEPGWHQVSGFSPVYTHLASAQGLQFVAYDSIIQNNEMYGATTVYTEAGKLETVELRFNKMGDKPKKWSEIEGGMNIGAPMFIFLIGMITWAM